MNIGLVRIRILLLENGLTIKDILPKYPKKNGTGISRARFYQLVERDSKDVELQIRKIILK